MKTLLYIIACCFITGLSYAGNDLKILNNSFRNDSRLISSNEPLAERFIATGEILVGRTHCTGTLISAIDAPDPEQKALILTAGHCFKDTFNTNEVIINHEMPGSSTFTPNYFFDNKPQHKSYNIKRVIYATMKNVDIAVFELNATYGELASNSIYPALIKKRSSSNNTQIELAHIPVVNVDDNERYLRYSMCNTLNSAYVYENNIWFWSQAVTTDCAGIAGGSSGAPVKQYGKDEIVGILNTTVTPGYTGCGLGRPCEVKDGNILSREGVSYYNPLDILVDSFNENNQIDLSKLDDGKGSGISVQRPVTQSLIDGNPATWNIVINEPTSDQFRYKWGRSGQIECSSSEGYGAPLNILENPLTSMQMPVSEEGRYDICIIVRNASDGKWQSTKNYSLAQREIDNTPPSIYPRVSVTDLMDIWQIILPDSRYEIVLTKFKYGPLNETDCSDRSDYIASLTGLVRINKTLSPVRFCAFGEDDAGNGGPALIKDLVNSETLSASVPHTSK